MNVEQENVFWETIDLFDKQGLLPYIMIVGSWAEYIYSYYFKTYFTPNMRTRYLDFLYSNIRKPQNRIDIISQLTQKGFVYREDTLTGVGKFFKENLLEIEFLTRAVGKGTATVKIPSIGITAESLRTINMLSDYPLELECKGYIITVPEPAVYVLQKLYTNQTRRPDKQEKDIRAIRELLPHIKSSENDNPRLKTIFECLHSNHQKVILKTCETNFIEL